MKIRRYLFGLAVTLCLSSTLYAGLVGISYDPNLNQNQIRRVNPLTGSTVLLNSFSFSSGGWNAETFSIDQASGRIYAQSGDQTLYTFGAYSGQILNNVVADTSLGAMDVGLSGNLVGISYNLTSMENEVRSANPATGTMTLLNSFNFSGGGYLPGTFATVPALNRFYVLSGDNTIYTFDLTTGQVLHTSPNASMESLAYWKAGELIGIAYDPQSMQNEVRILDPNTGATTLLNSFTFSSGGWIDTTFTVDQADKAFYAESGDGVLYTFNLTSGSILSTTQLDTTMQSLGVISPVPEPSELVAIGFIVAGLIRRKDWLR